MHSEARNTISKSSYLTQYRDEVSAKQKLLREKFGIPPPTAAFNSDLRSSQDKDDIPTIDDELTEQVSTGRQRPVDRLDYEPNLAESDLPKPEYPIPIDLEAEESLRFFKRNLLPNYQSPRAKPGTTATSGQTYSSEIAPNSNQPKYVSTLSDVGGPKLPTAREDPPAVRPILFKSGHLQQAQSSQPPPSIKDLVSRRDHQTTVPDNRRPQNGTIPSTKTYVDLTQPRPEPNPRLVDGGPLEQSKKYGPQVAPQVAPPEPPTQSRGVGTANNQVVESIRTTDSPSNMGSLSRKPLYNSLLRAHDSIRLKVNRPKVRPKSEQPVEDTIVVDDELELEPMGSSVQNETNERAVDVKRGSSRRKSKKKTETEKVPVRNFSEVRVVKIMREDNERSLGVTVKAEDSNIVVARIMAGSLADKQGALQVGDIILSVNNQEVYTPEQLQEQLRKNIQNDTVLMKIVPSFREELPTLCIYLRALFTYDANEDTLLPCKEVGVSFNQGDILEVVNQEDPNWWQARRVDSENLHTGLIPSQELEERRRAFVIPDYDLATRTSMCGTKVSRKSKKKEIYNVGQNCDFDKAELQLYEEVCRTPAFERRTLVLIGANGVGKQALKARLITLDPDRFGTPLPHTSRLPRDGEEDGVHYHFSTRERMEEDIIAGKYLEYGEYDGALYGTKLDSVREIIGASKVCVLDCSATCLKVLKTSDYLPFVAFIAAPTLDQLRYMHDYSRSGPRNYATLDRALNRQSRRARTLQDFAFDFFEEEDLQLTVEESARLFRIYENYFDIVLVNNNFERTFEQLRDAIDALSMAPQWIPISWIYGT